MRTHPFIRHLEFEFRSGLRDRSQLLLNYLFPLLFFALVSTLMGSINPGFRETMVGAMTVFAVMCSFLLGMPQALVQARESGLYRSYRINGVPVWATLAAPALANALHMIVVSLIVMAAGVVVFGGKLPDDPFRFVAGWLCLTGSMAGTGLLVAVVSSSARAATLVAQLVYIPSILLGGLMTPPDILPPALARVAAFFPATHGMRIFRGDPFWGLSAAALLLSALACAGVAAYLFEWDLKNARPARLRLLAVLPVLPFLVSAVLV